jgi:hypothetical protein
MGEGFAPGDQKASFVAIFVLFLLWWLSYLPRLFSSRYKTDENGEVRISRLQRTNDLARDGTLLLTIAVLIAFAGYSNVAATNTLSWIFLSIWVLILGLSYFRAKEPSKLINVMEFTGTTVLVALIITAFSTAEGRFGDVR